MMDIKYDAETKILTIKPSTENSTRTFRDLNFIKFLDTTTEPNVCDSTGFSYNGTFLESNSTDTEFYYELLPFGGAT